MAAARPREPNEEDRTMRLGRLVLGAAVALSLGAAAQAEELTLTEDQMDQVTAGGPIGDKARAAFAGLALGALGDGFSGGIGGGQAASGITVLREYVLLEILIAKNGL
jgi:hypothetical protein